MKLTLSQLNRVIKEALRENKEEVINPLTVEDDSGKVKAVLTHTSDDKFELEVNGEKIQKSDMTSDKSDLVAAIVGKAFFDLPEYVSNNPEDTGYVKNLHKIIEKTIEGGIESLKGTNASRLVSWNTLLTKSSRGVDRIS